MNKKGNVYFGITIGLFLFISGVLFLPFLTDDIDTARAELNCDNPSAISNGTMVTCIAINGLTPYFIWFFISLAIGTFIGTRS